MSGPKCDAIELRRREKQRRKEEYRKRLAAEQARLAAEAAERARQEEEKRRAEAAERKAREAEERARLAEERRLEAERARREEEKRRAEEFDAAAEAEYQALRQFQEQRETELRRSEQELWKLREQRERFEEALSLYQAAAKLAGKSAERFEYDIETSEEQIRRMNRLAEELQEQTVERECRAQVSALIDRVITDMGYELMAEKVSGAEEEVRAGLYRYEGNTAISVIEAGGQFTMEVVALSGEDRPAKPEEAEMLYESMGKFCEDYGKIKEKLEETGQVVSRSIFHMPPDRRLARVINREEYEKRGGTKKRKYDENYTKEQIMKDEMKRIEK